MAKCHWYLDDNSLCGADECVRVNDVPYCMTHITELAKVFGDRLRATVVDNPAIESRKWTFEIPEEK